MPNEIRTTIFPYLVIDQNQLRKPDAVTDAASRCRVNGFRLLIPDGAGFELSKSSEVFDTWRNSLEFLSPFTEEIVVSGKMTGMMSIEASTGFPIRDLVDDGASVLFRGILAELGNNDASSLSRLVTGPVSEKLPTSLKTWSDFEMHRSVIVRMRDLLREALTEREVKELRRDPSTELASWLSSCRGARFVYQGIASRGVDEVSALRLASMPSATGAFISSLSLVALHWLAFGGLETAKPEKVTNDLHDLEYAVLGSLSVDLLTADKRLQAINAAVTRAQISRQDWVKDQLSAAEYRRLIVSPAEIS